MSDVNWKAEFEAVSALHIEARERITAALEVIGEYGQTDGAHHKAWVLDQAARLLMGCESDERGVVGSSPSYRDWVLDMKAGEDGPETYDYDPGIAP